MPLNGIKVFGRPESLLAAAPNKTCDRVQIIVELPRIKHIALCLYYHSAQTKRTMLQMRLSVYSNDKNNNHDTDRRVLEFATNQEQPEQVGSLIRLKVTLF